MSEGKDDQPVVGSAAQPAADIVRERAPGFQPRVGIVLGSGMGDVGGIIEDPITISYADRKHLRRPLHCASPRPQPPSAPVPACVATMPRPPRDALSHAAEGKGCAWVA